jgi:protein arginine kinase
MYLNYRQFLLQEHLIGKSEKQIIQEVESSVLRLFDMENNIIEKIKESNDVNLFDTILRAFGTLKYCYRLSSKEFQELCALSKLGCELGLIDNIYMDVLDELNYAVKPANLVKLNGSYLSDNERDLFRAKYVSNILNNVDAN